MDVYLVEKLVEPTAVKMVELLVACLEAKKVELWVDEMVDMSVG